MNNKIAVILALADVKYSLNDLESITRRFAVYKLISKGQTNPTQKYENQ